MRFSTLIVIAALLAITVLPAAATLLNPGAESGTWNSSTQQRLTNWTFTLQNGTSNNWFHGAHTYSFHGGAKAGGARITSGSQKYAYYTQTATDLTYGGAYRVHAWLRGYTVSLDSWIRLGAKTGGAATYTEAAAATTSTWTEYTVDVLASGTGTIDIRFYLHAGAGHGSIPVVLFDDVSLEAIPEPSSMLALLSGLPIIGFAIRRRKA